MPLNRMMPDKPLRVAQIKNNTVNANSDAPRATMFTVPVGRKFTVYALETDQSAANVDLIAFHIIGQNAVQLADFPTQRFSTDERVLPQFEPFSTGESLTMGLRNGTGGNLTPQLVVYYTDEPA
jgi:hypothetical protein